MTCRSGNAARAAGMAEVGVATAGALCDVLRSHMDTAGVHGTSVCANTNAGDSVHEGNHVVQWEG